jgi:hypothetical protein
MSGQRELKQSLTVQFLIDRHAISLLSHWNLMINYDICVIIALCHAGFNFTQIKNVSSAPRRSKIAGRGTSGCRLPAEI